jgi:hypothetical protein
MAGSLQDRCGARDGAGAVGRVVPGRRRRGEAGRVRCEVQGNYREQDPPHAGSAGQTGTFTLTSYGTMMQ